MNEVVDSIVSRLSVNHIDELNFQKFVLSEHKLEKLVLGATVAVEVL